MDMGSGFEIIPLDFKGLQKSLKITGVQGLKWIEGSLFAVFDTKRELKICIDKGQGKFECIFSTSKGNKDIRALTNPGGLAKIDGNNFLIVDRLKKTLYRFDTNSNKLEPYLNLIALKNSEASEILNSQMSQINDIEYRDNKVWFICKAGYSSSVCCVDPKTGELFFKFFTRGSEPKSMSFGYMTDYIWILDSNKKEVSRFDINGNYMDSTVINHKNLSNPVGLGIDNSGKLWIANQLKVKEGR